MLDMCLEAVNWLTYPTMFPWTWSRNKEKLKTILDKAESSKSELTIRLLQEQLISDWSLSCYLQTIKEGRGEGGLVGRGQCDV